MTINDPVKFCAGLWDWGILDGCFGDTKIKPTDIDGEVERHGKLLRFEAKSPGTTVPIGQMILFEALAKTQIFTIFIIWGETNKPEEIQIITRHGKRDKKACDLNKLRKLVSRWFEYADGY